MNHIVEIPKEYVPTIAYLPESLQFIAEQIEEHMPGKGIEYTLVVSQAFRGLRLYIRSTDKFLNQIQDKAVCSEFNNGVPVNEIKKQFNLTEREIEKIINKK